MTLAELIHDWNPSRPGAAPRRPMLDDETLRDGLQSPSVRDPDVAAKRDLLHRLAALGIDAVDLGMPGAGSSPEGLSVASECTESHSSTFRSRASFASVAAASSLACAKSK